MEELTSQSKSIRTRTRTFQGYKKYTQKDLRAAIEEVRKGISVPQAAKHHGIPARTLYEKFKAMGISFHHEQYKNHNEEVRKDVNSIKNARKTSLIAPINMATKSPISSANSPITTSGLLMVEAPMPVVETKAVLQLCDKENDQNPGSISNLGIVIMSNEPEVNIEAIPPIPDIPPTITVNHPTSEIAFTRFNNTQSNYQQDPNTVVKRFQDYDYKFPTSIDQINQIMNSNNDFVNFPSNSQKELDSEKTFLGILYDCNEEVGSLPVLQSSSSAAPRKPFKTGIFTKSSASSSNAQNAPSDHIVKNKSDLPGGQKKERKDCQFCREVFGYYESTSLFHDGCYIP